MVAVRLFGPIEVRVNLRCLGPRDFGGVKPKQLLEVLLIQRGRPLAKDQLAEMIWGDSPPRKVAATIESYVSLLRSRLGEASGLIATETGGYRADLGRAWVDLDEFDALLREAAGAPPVERRQRLEAALAIATRDVLEDEPYADWAMDLRGVYAERRLQATCDLAETCLALLDPRVAVELAEQALVLDPLVVSSSCTPGVQPARTPPAQASGDGRARPMSRATAASITTRLVTTRTVSTVSERK